MSDEDERMALSSLQEKKEDRRPTMPDKSPEITTTTTRSQDERARSDFDHANDVVNETVSSMFTAEIQSGDFGLIFVGSMRFFHGLMMFDRFEQVCTENE